MSSISAGSTAYRDRERSARAGSWYSALGADGRRAFKAAFAGYTLDAFDLIALTLSLTAIGATFDVGTGATGALSTVTLYLFVVIAGAFLGYLTAGLVHDRIGRRKTFALFASLAGLALVLYFAVPSGSNTA